MRLRAILPTAVAFGSLGVALIGCGTATQPVADTATTLARIARGPPLSKAQFVARARAACDQFRQDFDAIPFPREDADLQAIVEPDAAMARAVDRFARALRMLTPPDAARPALDRYVGWLQQQAVLTGQMRDAAARGDATGVGDVSKRLDELLATTRFRPMRQYGLAGCTG